MQFGGYKGFRFKREWQCSYKRNVEARSHNDGCRVKEINITYCECVSVAIVVQDAVRMRHTILLSVAFPTVPYFPTSHKW